MLSTLLLTISLAQPYRRAHYDIVDLSGHAVYRASVFLSGEGGTNHFWLVAADEFGSRYVCEWQVLNDGWKGRIESLADEVSVESTMNVSGAAAVGIFHGYKAYEFVSLDRGRSFASSSDQARDLVSRDMARFIVDSQTSSDDPLRILLCGPSCPPPSLRMIPAAADCDFDASFGVPCDR